MVVKEVTASTIAMEEDKREDQRSSKSQIDMTKLKADIAAQMALAQHGQLSQALEALLNLEKSSRQAEDVTASKACCTAILEACFNAKDWRLLEEHVLLLAKRRGQLKQVSCSLISWLFLCALMLCSYSDNCCRWLS